MAQILVSVDDIVVGEKDGFAEFVVRLNAPSAAPVSINYFTENGSAVANSDYIGIGTNTLIFAPGEMAKTVRVPIVDDTAVEAKESFFFISSARPAAPSSATLTPWPRSSTMTRPRGPR